MFRASSTPPPLTECLELSGAEGIEAFVGVSQEGDIHLRHLISNLAGSLCSLEMSSSIGLVNLIDREVCGIDVGCQPGFKWCAYATKTVEINAAEEGVCLDFIRRDPAQAVLRITNKARLCQCDTGRIVSRNLPSDEVLRLGSKLDVVREVEGCPPVDNLSVSVRCLFSAERWPSDLAFKHNGSKTPPVTVV